MESERIFIDTSAHYALMDRSDSHHKQAVGSLTSLLEKDAHLLTSNYVILETVALLQNRLGFEAANLWYRDVLGVVEIMWIDQITHKLAFELWLSLGRRRLSLVDCVSFVAMRNYKVEKVFGFDRHFAEQGFEIISN
ncbi:MAG: PIN domain-containing protein [Thermodesulfobacteriota bacterium]|nr:PIN domain-containing protein [Thermodesulfobacteriota bacterium]